MSDDERQARAEARRARVVIRRTVLGRDDEGLEGMPGERVALAFALTRASWAMTGKPWPAAGTGRAIVRFLPGRRD